MEFMGNFFRSHFSSLAVLKRSHNLGFLLVLLLPFSGAQAQFEGSDSYDPFADYSEYQEAAEEEADINFFRNGRFLTLGFVLGPRSYTGTYGQISDMSNGFGVNLGYFFDLRFALNMSYVTADHPMTIVLPSKTLAGNSTLSNFGFNLKYYLNVQNVTRGLGAFNPFVLGGMSRFTVQNSFTTEDLFSNDTVSSFDFGGGIEFPMLRNKMYIGIQGIYHIMTFPDENQLLAIGNEVTNVTLEGDVYSIQGIIGVNF